MWRQAYLRLRSLFRRHRQESELDEEIRFHLANEAGELMAAGMSPEEARAAARRDFGNVTLIRELTREAWGWAPAERFLHDIRSAIRGMQKAKGWTLVVLVSLALGIGANTALFSAVDGMLFRTLPAADPNGLVRLRWAGDTPQVTFYIRGVSAEAAREGIGRIDPGVPVVNVATMTEMVDTALLPTRIAAVVSGFVGAGGLLLACIGLFGTLSYVVALRAPEIGLRVALGARPLQIIRLVAGSTSVKLVTVGVVVGAGLGSGVSPLLQSQFSRTSGVDPVALAGAAACLALVAFVAVGLPVSRALRIDPAEVLRVEE